MSITLAVRVNAERGFKSELETMSVTGPLCHHDIKILNSSYHPDLKQPPCLSGNAGEGEQESHLDQRYKGEQSSVTTDCLDCQVARASRSMPPGVTIGIITYLLLLPLVRHTVFPIPVNGLARSSDPSPRPSWCDTFCVPVERDLKEYRKKAIARMGATYTSARKVLTLNRSLLNISQARPRFSNSNVDSSCLTGCAVFGLYMKAFSARPSHFN